MTDEQKTADDQPDFETAAVLVDLDPAQLEAEIIEFTGHLSRAGALHAEACRREAYAKLQLDTVEAYNRLQLRREHELAGQKPTEKTLDAAIAALQPVIAARTTLIEAHAEVARLRAQVDALKSKERMLDLLGRRHIAEMRMDPNATLGAASRSSAWADMPRLGG